MGAGANGRYYAPAATLAAGTETLNALTATANGTAFNLDGAVGLISKVDITARSGTSPTLDVSLQARVDSDGAWVNVAAHAQVTAVSSTKRAFQVAGFTQARWVKTVGGTTPSFTGTITASKV